MHWAGDRAFPSVTPAWLCMGHLGPETVTVMRPHTEGLSSEWYKQRQRRRKPRNSRAEAVPTPRPLPLPRPCS